jgi:predicted RNA polymerase sigma factor
MLERLGRPEEADLAYTEAIALSDNDRERARLERKRNAVRRPAHPSEPAAE